MTEPDFLRPASPEPAAVAYRVPSLGLVRVRGQDSVKVLSGLCTAKLQEMAVGSAKEAFFTDDRGRVLEHAVVGRDVEGMWVVGQLARPDVLAAHIDRFIFREDATPGNVTAQWYARLVDGTEAWTRLASLTETSPSLFGDLGIASFKFSGLAAIVVRLPITSPTALLCLVPAEHSAVLEQMLAGAGFQTQPSAEELETRRIANFWPVAGREISERTLPQELDRDQRAISFTKGCYLGQETVARLDSLGEVQKKLCLVRLTTAEAAEAGQSLTRDGKEVGKLTSVAPLPLAGQHLALAYMRRGSIAPGSEFEFGAAAGAVLAHAP